MAKRQMPQARTYHHGDLRHALIEEGVHRARTGGMDAVTMREVTRAIGVSPNAAYRHFADRRDLIRAVAAEAQLALARAIRAGIDAAPSGRSTTLPTATETDAEAAVERLRRIGLAYIGFARSERGWFTLALAVQDEQPGAGMVTLDDEVVPPFQLLLDALDAMRDSGALDPERRPHAEWTCWAAVHGFAELAVHGPLQWQPEPVIDALAAAVVEAAITGIRGAPAPLPER